MNLYLLRPIHPMFPHLYQGFGEHNLDYSRFGLVGHDGLDYDAPLGADVYAAHGGRVVVGHDPTGYGDFIYIYSGDYGGFHTCYAHLALRCVEDGALVEPGQVIGKVGMTGNTNAPHLHFGLKLDAGQNPGYHNWVDPTPYRQ